MKVFADNLRTRAKALGLVNAEVARRAGIPERTFANYVLDRTEPSLDALVRISRALQCTVDELLSAGALDEPMTQRDAALARIRSGIETLDDSDAEAIAAQVEAVLKVRHRHKAIRTRDDS